MSYAELFTVHANGDVCGGVTLKNNHRGAPLLWQWLLERYLPDLTWVDIIIGRSSDRLWALVNDERLLRDERVALASTFDDVIIRTEHVADVAACLRSVSARIGDMGGGPIHAHHWPDHMLTAIQLEGARGLAFNQCSANSDVWEHWDSAKAEADEDYTGSPHNVDRHDGHYYLFERYPNLLEHTPH